MKHIFISYCRKDKEWKDLLVKHLQAANLDDKCTLWEDSMIGLGSDWEPEIQKALKNARIAIFLITVDFLNSKFIKNIEVPTLLKRRAEEGITIIPILAKPCAWKAVKWLSSIKAYSHDGKCLSELSIKKRDNSLADFALYITELLEKLEELPTLPQDPANEKKEPISQTSITPNSIDHEGPVMFVGREKELAQIEECIPNKDKNEPFSGSIQTITGRLFNIDGAGGIGKTTLAIEAARKFGHRFKDGVLPPFRADELSPTAFAMELAQRLNVHVNEPPDKERAKDLISALLKERQLLLILDNVVKWSDLAYMLPRETPSMILITTRDREIYHHLRMNCRAFQVSEIALERFSREEALQLFRSMLDKDYKTNDEPIYDQIASNLGYLPIALRQSISLMIYAPRYSPSQLLDKLSKEDRLELLRKGNALESSDSRTIETVFDLSSSLLTPQLIEALQYLSVCSPGPVTCSFLQALTTDNEIAERLELLYTYSWVERRENQGACTYELHQLVRELIKQRYNNPFTREMIQCVHHMFTDKSMHYSIKEENFFQLEEAFRLACEIKDKRLKDWLYDLYYFCTFRGYGEFYIRLTQAVERLFPEDKWALRAVYGNQAIILQDWGKLNEAMALHKKEENIKEELGDRAGLATCYGNQALILKDWGKLDAAMDYLKKQETICQELGDRAGLSACYGNQAIILKDWGKLDEAMALHKKQEEISEELGDRAGLSRSYCNQALILNDWGKFDEAMDYLKKQEAICEELGDRAGLAICWWNQGELLGKQGDTPKQIELWKKSIETFKSMNMPTEKLEAELEELVKGC